MSKIINWLLEKLGAVVHFVQFVARELWNTLRRLFQQNATGQTTTPTPQQTVPKPTLDRNQQNGVSTWLTADIAYLKARTNKVREEHEEDTPEVSEGLFWAVTLGMFVAIIAIILGTILFIPSEIIAFGVTELNPRIFVYVLIVIYLLCGFRTVETDKVAGLDFFGTPVFQFGHGLKWFPYLLFNFTKESAFLVQAEFPGDANKIHWEGDKTDLPQGKVRPIYILTGENPNGTLPSEKQINLGVALMVKIQTTTPRFFDLVRNTPPIDQENGDEILGSIVGNANVTPRLLEILRHLRDTSARIAAEILGQLSYNEITTHRALVDEWIEERLRLEVVVWGVELREGGFTILNPGHAYNLNIESRANAIAERDSTTIRAEGVKQKLILEGEGTAKAQLAQFRAEAKGKKAIRDALDVSGEAVLASELGEKIAEGGNAVIADGLGGLGAMFGAGSEAFKKAKDKT